MNIKGMSKLSRGFECNNPHGFQTLAQALSDFCVPCCVTQIHYISDDLWKRYLFEVKIIHRKIKLKIMTHTLEVKSMISIKFKFSINVKFKFLINLKFLINVKFIVYRFLSWKLINTKFSTCSYLVKGLHIQHGLGDIHKRHSCLYWCHRHQVISPT